MLRHLPLLESNQTGVAVSHIVRFIVAQKWPLAEQRRLEGTRYWFLLPKRSLGEFVYSSLTVDAAFQGCPVPLAQTRW